MPRIRLVRVFDRHAQERLGEAYGLLVRERTWPTRGTQDHEHCDATAGAGNGRDVSAGIESSSARPGDDRQSA